MNWLGKFAHMAPGDRGLLVEATLVVIAIRLSLWLLPFGLVFRLWAPGLSAGESAEGDTGLIARTAWAVTAASRRVLGATCLTQALAARILLARRGCPAQLRIGVQKGAAGDLHAHAWLESRGRVIIGGGESPARFTPLPSLEGERR